MALNMVSAQCFFGDQTGNLKEWWLLLGAYSPGRSNDLKGKVRASDREAGRGP